MSRRPNPFRVDRRVRFVASALVCLLSVGSAAAAPGAAPSPAEDAVGVPSSPVGHRAGETFAPGRQDLFLGFVVGEERHWVMGPPEALGPRERARWTVRLEGIEGEADERRGVFRVLHQRDAPRMRRELPDEGSVTNAVVDAELRVDRRGVVRHLVYTSQRHLFDVGPELLEIAYREDGDRFEKKVRVENGAWDLHVDLPEGVDPRRSPPTGPWVYAPTSIACLEWGIVGEAAVEACNELNVDPAFAAPGLLGFAVFSLWDRGGEGEVVLLTPKRPDLQPGGGRGIPISFVPIVPGMPGTAGGGNFITGSGIPGLELLGMLGGGGASGDEDRARDPARTFPVISARFIERASVEIGSRSVEGLRLRLQGYPHDIWVDDDGSILRVDITTDPGGAGTRRWIRQLFPSEY